MTKKISKVYDRCIYATLAPDFARHLTDSNILKIASQKPLQETLSKELSISDEKSMSLIRTFLEQISSRWLIASLKEYKSIFTESIIDILELEIKKILASQKPIFKDGYNHLAVHIYESICENIGNLIQDLEQLEFDEMYQKSKLGEFFFDQRNIALNSESVNRFNLKFDTTQSYPKMSYINYIDVEKKLNEIKNGVISATDLLVLIDEVRYISIENGSDIIVESYFSDDDVNDLKQIAKRLKPVSPSIDKSKYDSVYLYCLLLAYHNEEDLYVFTHEGV